MNHKTTFTVTPDIARRALDLLEMFETPACLGTLAPMSIREIVSRYPSLTQDEKYDLALAIEAKVLMHGNGKALF